MQRNLTGWVLPVSSFTITTSTIWICVWQINSAAEEMFVRLFKNPMLNFDSIVASVFLLGLEPFVKLSSCAGNNQKETCYEGEHTSTSMWAKENWKCKNREESSLAHQKAEQYQPNPNAGMEENEREKHTQPSQLLSGILFRYIQLSMFPGRDVY